VVLKAGRWYLVASGSDPAKITAYRVSSILDAVVLDEPVERPAGFDLTAFWRDWTERFEGSVYTASARVRMTESALAMMSFIFPPEMSRRARAAAGEPDPSGWLVTDVPIESIRHGHVEILRLGADAEVLGPPELRERFAETVRGMTDLYLTTDGKMRHDDAG